MLFPQLRGALFGATSERLGPRDRACVPRRILPSPRCQTLRAPDRAETGFNPVDRLSLAPRQCRLTLSGIGPGNAAYPARCAFAPQVKMEAPLKPGFFSFMCRGADLVRLCAARDLVEKLL